MTVYSSVYLFTSLVSIDRSSLVFSMFYCSLPDWEEREGVLKEQQTNEQRRGKEP